MWSARKSGLRSCAKRRRGSVLPSPDNVPVQPSRLLRGTSHRKVSLVEYPAFEPLDLAQPIALFRLWRERRVGGTRYGNHTRNGLRYMLLEVSALGARDRLSTSHYRGRSPCPSQSPYGGGSPGVPSETWVRAVGDRWTRRSPRSFPLPVQSGLRGRRNATTSPEFMAAKPCTLR